MNDLGTAEKPLRASRLARFMSCPWSEVLHHLKLIDDGGGVAADTGSAVHHAIRLYHKELKGEIRNAVAAMRLAIESYPRADCDAAEKMFLGYAYDRRNQEAEVVATEEKIEVVVDDVVIQGTLDQVRVHCGSLAVCDAKTGIDDGPTLLDMHQLQLAAYLVGARQIGHAVQSAYIIRIRDYASRTPGRVFWEEPWGYREAMQMLQSVAAVVKQVRQGNYWLVPSKHCRYCVGVSTCTQEMKNNG